MTQDLPEGFAYYPDALTEAEETALLDFIQTLDLGPFVHMGNPSLRHVRNFGVDFDYERKIAVEAPPIPAAFDPVLDRVAALTGTPRADLAELLVTRYTPGASITWHRDSRPFEAIFGVSLLGDAPLKLRPANPKNAQPILTVPVARRSVYALTGAARSKWLHHVPPVKETRISLTIRTLRPGLEIHPAADLAQYQRPGQQD